MGVKVDNFKMLYRVYLNKWVRVMEHRYTSEFRRKMHSRTGRWV